MKKIILATVIVLFLGVVIFYLSLGAPFDPEQSEYYDLVPPENLERTIYNSMAGNYTTFVKKSVETNGEYTLLEIDLEPGGENGPHYHLDFSEEFTAVSGTVGVHINGENHYLEEGESKLADTGDVHYFFNNSNEKSTFQVRIEPGSPGFEKSLYILYGLVNDGLVDEEGLPTDILHTALFAAYSDTRASGLLRVMNPIFSRLAGKAQREGIESDLIERYYLSRVIKNE